MIRETHCIKSYKDNKDDHDELEQDEQFINASFAQKVQMIVRNMQPPKWRRVYGQYFFDS